MKNVFSCFLFSCAFALAPAAFSADTPPKNEPKAEKAEDQHPKKRPLEKRIDAMERRVDKWHEQEKLTDQQYQSLKGSLGAVKEELAKIEGKLPKDERQKILGRLKEIQMEMVEDLHLNKGGAEKAESEVDDESPVAGGKSLGKPEKAGGGVSSAK